MNTQTTGIIADDIENADLSDILAQQPTLTNFVNQAGLGEIARMVEGENYVVCDLDLHGVQGCADMREMVQNQQVMAECVAIGLAILVAVVVGSIAVGFVNIVTKLAAPIGKNRVYALFPLGRRNKHTNKEHPA
ncbi:hypothetical protein [uncultured Roseovarius sp.]|uniref:hypothetical protein n=1 Tax=uncultured Roseovarius sp. TaxID=293344 RepID=UPI00262227F7|nr:hypothetical protein [uncultured Roseovarius sp.]